MRTIGTCLATTFFLLGGVAIASGTDKSHADGTAYLPNGQFGYGVFEASVEHVDLETCPVEFDDAAVFCRMTLASDLAHVFAFLYDGEQPLVAVKSYELADGFLPF